MITKVKPAARTTTRAMPEPPDPPIFRRRRGSRPLGPFAYAVIKAVKALGPDRAYGIAIEEHMSNQLRALVDLAQVYVVLKRLQKRGFLTPRKSPAPTGSGQTVVVYAITGEGMEAMAEAARFYNQLYEQEEGGDGHTPQSRRPARTRSSRKHTSKVRGARVSASGGGGRDT